ncbi:DUF4832 domain-containing protein [Mycetocola zhujimingii]|uniref:DUF4832 domain-containing protein n=1 Tax=Mycetocola zhujimingii TaxID=2079792 RepID=UPI000EA9AFC3|nr:DUF4832 domain-containing protein [Mycetocola zhujimingii]
MQQRKNRKRFVPIGIALAGIAALAIPSAAVAAPGDVTVQYEESAGVIANPERGFYDHTETHYRADGSGYVPLNRAEIEAFRTEGVTQILRVFYLEKFVNTPTLDPEFLALVQADYDTAREAGISVITRFAYVQGGAWPYEPPHGDAPLDIVLAHIEQLTPILRANADVIPVVQNGLIGLWGEGYYTDHFVADPANPGVVTEEDWANRSAVTDALLEALPADRSVQVRTMLSKQKLLDVPTGAAGAITPAQAHDGSDISRVGHHNDCFLAAPDDWGTFLSDPIELDQEYLEADSKYVPIGGETCNVNPPRSEWASASAEMARYNYSYLNRDYNKDVLNTWGAEGIEETAQRLGYRFVMTESTLSADDGGATQISVDVRNDGWAAPYNPRTAVLVLEGDMGRFEVPFDGNDDARLWMPGTTTTLTASFAGIPDGEYRAYLALPAGDAGTSVDAPLAIQAVSDDPRFAIQTANVDTWDPATGLNALGQTVTIGAAAPVVTPAPVDPADPAPEVPAPAAPGAAPGNVAPVVSGDDTTDARDPLANTGSESSPLGLAVAAAVAMLIGTGALVALRRRQSQLS